MSYLDLPRLHFTATFTADPSTLNNSLENFTPQNDITPSWNAYGSHAFTLKGTITTVRDQHGILHTPANSSDPLIGATIQSTHNPAFAPVDAKIIDLDPEAYLRTCLFGLYIEVSQQGSPLIAAAFSEQAALSNLWFFRYPGVLVGDTGLGGTWQSPLLKPLWGQLSGSPLLQQLYQTSPLALSIRIVAYGFEGNKISKTYRQGKIVGTIGPRFPHEAQYTEAARELFPMAPQLYETGSGSLWQAPFKINRAIQSLTVDLGNAIPTQSPQGPPQPFRALQFFIKEQPLTNGRISYQRYCAAAKATASILQIPLTATEQNSLTHTPLQMSVLAEERDPIQFDDLAEHQYGIYITVDQKLVLLNQGDAYGVDVYVTEYGQPCANYTLNFEPASESENMEGLQFSQEAVTDQNGRATLYLQTTNFKLPPKREYVGGKIFTLQYKRWQRLYYKVPPPLTVKLFQKQPLNETPTWADVQPLFHRFYRLYGWMANIIDLSDYQAIKQAQDKIAQSMRRPYADPGYMPTSRDLSRSQIDLILRWLDMGCPYDNEPI